MPKKLLQLGIFMIFASAIIMLLASLTGGSNVYTAYNAPDSAPVIADTEPMVVIAETKPEVKEEIVAEVTAIVTAYNPLPEQTDNTPFINAMGRRVQDGDIANNCLPFESKVEIDGRIYTVRDRMNSRYGCEYFDVFMWNYQEAIHFGRQIKEIKIL